MGRLIIYGNCQAGALANILSNVEEITENLTITMLDIWAAGADLDKQLELFHDTETKFLLLQDLSNWKRHPLFNKLPAHIHVVRFPFVYLAALWPFDTFVAGSQDHPMLRAARAPNAPTPFPFGFHDAALGRLRDSVADPEERLSAYRELRFSKVPNLVRYAEYEEARLLNDDKRLGYSIGRFVVDNYRHIRLFHAITHPTVQLIERLAFEVLGQLGFPRAIDEVPPMPHDYLKQYQVPLHPKVIEALSLEWVSPATEYQQLNGEMLSFDDYFRRYVNFPVE